MSYKELKSLYYGDNEVYAHEYLNRFNSEETKKINFHIGESQAFFVQNTEVMTLAYKIEKLDKEIVKLCNALPGVAIDPYSKKCIIDEIYRQLLIYNNCPLIILYSNCTKEVLHLRVNWSE